MRSLRIIIISFFTFLFVTSAIFWQRAIAELLTGTHKLNKFMREIRFWLLGIVSFVIATITTVFVSGSFLNRLVLAASCTIFSFNSTFCTPSLEVESDRVLAFESYNNLQGHQLATYDTLKKIDVEGNKFTISANDEIDRADRSMDLKETYLDLSGSEGAAGSVYACNQLGICNLFSDEFKYPYKHFSDEQIKEGSDWLITLKNQILDQLKLVTQKNEADQSINGAGLKARQYLGQALHAIQDFYAHSNWIELGHIEDTNKDLGIRLLCSDHDQIACAAPDEVTAKEVVKHDNGLVNGAYTDYDQSTLHPELRKLTSGYFKSANITFLGREWCEAPKIKVYHGGVSCPGFNHDDPGSKLYPIAEKLAIESGKNYIKLITDSLLKDDKENGIWRVKALMGIQDSPKDAPCNPSNNQSKSEDKQDNKPDKNQCPIAANIWGDPHMNTFDGLKYDLQTLGEFTLVKSHRSNFEVQSRHIPYNSSGSLAISSAVAVKVGSDRVAIYAQELPDADTTTPLRVNGKPTTLQGDKLSLKGGGEILRQGGNYVMSAPTGEKVLVSSNGSYLNISPIVDNRAGKYSGLLGNVNGNPKDDLQTRSGKNVLEARSTYGDVKQVVNLVGLRLPGVLDRAEQVYFDQLYKEFANSWRVKQEESLLDYLPGKTTQSYVNPGFPDKYLTLNMLSADQIQKAQNACTEAKVTPDLMEGCIFDVGFSGFSGFARTTAEISGYISIVNQLIPGLNIPTPNQVVDQVIQKVKPKVCLPFIGCI